MRVVVTGGGTIAPIDDVRRIVNTSTGRFSSEIAEAFLGRGDEVWHVHAPGAQLPVAREAAFDLDAADLDAEFERLRRLRRRWEAVRPRLRLRPLPSGTVREYAEVLGSTLIESRPDVVLLAMAASDYAPVPVDGKISSDAASLDLRLVRMPKVIRSVRDQAPGAYLVGFKLLSGSTPDQLIRDADRGLVENRVDLTVANDLRELRAGRHTLRLVRPGRPVETLGPMAGLAAALVGRIADWAGDRLSRG